ncbi:LOW QUALITY PROTEIN: glucan endo-1,3-beta-glucosidase 7-like [Dioscorea cayenensis subsp. rotundata]|uniref:glucan endo-1,3-beta-D-glucosidase n=1 Tax=Dioscorea cayennensis subsp. rotundata TaxID=55577 RepID=A0AB40CB80_DIOCR|nr:LOW QUALITY PROTEIN: glucan endo-1,3-beta-glucosidase 7-like [Dioscorea cayenensis subsp. rotundata]
MEKITLLLLLSPFLLFSARSQSFIGVNYGEEADNLPSPDATARLLQSTTISKLRLYAPDAALLRSLASTDITVILGVPNSDLPTLASSSSAASTWASSNLLPFLPSPSIPLIAVGNEALNSGDPSLPPLLLPAMQNLQSALSSTAPQIKISTVHSMAVLSQSDPPSAGAFHSDLSSVLSPILHFLQDNGSPFMINPYPFFAYRSDTRPETLAFCLFQPNPGRVDPVSSLTYSNMFDAQVDAIRSALDAMGFTNLEIVVAETGWPYRGDADEVGASVDNAKAFNGGLVAHLRSMVGTPKMPGKSVDTYIFALYDEDLKAGPTSERSFGLFRPDLTMTYDAGLSKTTNSSPASPASPTEKPACETTSNVSSSFSCGQASVECSVTLPGGSCLISEAAGVKLLYLITSSCLLFHLVLIS